MFSNTWITSGLVKRTMGLTAILSLFLTHSKDSNFFNCFRVYIDVR